MPEPAAIPASGSAQGSQKLRSATSWPSFGSAFVQGTEGHRPTTLNVTLQLLTVRVRVPVNWSPWTAAVV